MNKSESIKELVTALAVAQGRIEAAKKDVNNTYFESKYADLASCWGVCRAPLSENGLAVIQIPEFADGVQSLETILTHSSGEWISSRMGVRPGYINKQNVFVHEEDVQALGSAITYLRRYALCAIVGIAPEDDDGNKATATKGTTGTVKTSATTQPAATKSAPSPKDPPMVTLAGDWQDVVCHVAPWKDRALGELSKTELSAAQKGFTPKINPDSGEFQTRDLILHTALRLSLQGVPKNKAPGANEQPTTEEFSDDASPKTLAARAGAASKAVEKYGSGKWKLVVVHDGKHKGKTLQWIRENDPSHFHVLRVVWTPKLTNGTVAAKDFDLREVLNVAHAEYEEDKARNATIQNHPEPETAQ